MTLLGLIIRIAITAIILTGLNYLMSKKKPEWAEIENWGISYLQNFCGALFIFSGYVKAIDPKGTAYKMEQYFGEFKTHFFDFLLPVWDFFGEYALLISLIMIIFEIVLGVMLILGYTRKLTAWLFLLLVIFFTFLTGFTYLTGYVPEGVNFFSFGDWGSYEKANMKVTDCGCFGDYIKLEPKVSFFKDVFLLIPGILFLLIYAKKHVLFTKKIRNILLAISAVIVTAFCYINTYSGLPVKDFRPFKNGTDVRAVKADEEERVGNAPVFYRVKHIDTKEVKDIPMDEYLKVFNDEDFKAKWEFVDQIREEVKTTKISEFLVTGEDGTDVAQKILDHPGYHVMVVSYQWKYTEGQEKAIFKDSLFVSDTLAVEGQADSFQIVQRLDRVNETEYMKTTYDWNQAYADKYRKKINPLMEAAEKDGAWVYGITKPYSPEQIDEFRHEIQATYPFFTADDILLKTIIRSNPGVVLWKDGKIIKKWHINHVPDYATMKANYMN